MDGNEARINDLIVLNTPGREKLAKSGVRPMTMETRCSKVIFPNYSTKKPAEDTLVPPILGTREKKMFVFLG